MQFSSMAVILRAFLTAVLASALVEVSGETHHEATGWGPFFNVTSWLDGRVFRRGDKLWFYYSEPDGDMIVEVKGPKELEACDLSNPIQMYTDHVPLDRRGMHYFASANLRNCNDGLKLAVPVEEEEYDQSEWDDAPPERYHGHEGFGPPSRRYEPPYGYEPPHGYEPPVRPAYPPPSRPSGAAGVGVDVAVAVVAVLAGVVCIRN
ncbi:hypothetical protein M569_13394 [Genlisea aurea]|uniref:Phytocyanin domain-containing protein n=1 Tax=Genlisea aurea TaxID=192259 RepID=S8CAM3_9LAMI|nr:hypothetical protein M569_13394 [Genlisea aurea]